MLSIMEKTFEKLLLMLKVVQHLASCCCQPYFYNTTTLLITSTCGISIFGFFFAFFREVINVLGEKTFKEVRQLCQNGKAKFDQGPG